MLIAVTSELDTCMLKLNAGKVDFSPFWNDCNCNNVACFYQLTKASNLTGFFITSRLHHWVFFDDMKSEGAGSSASTLGSIGLLVRTIKAFCCLEKTSTGPFTKTRYDALQLSIFTVFKVCCIGSYNL
jgi:hypothetical protein